MRRSGLFALAISTMVACGQDPEFDAWSRAFTPPNEHDTERVHLEPLHPQHTELDFAALMSSREHLRETLHWGEWPREDFTTEGNREDLERHWMEFENREAYAYTVLTPDRSRCIGCIYLGPVESKPRAASLAYWVVADELTNDLDRHLLDTVLGWTESDWPFDEVILPTHTDNARGMMIAKERGLDEGPRANDRVRFVWRRGER